eukprot:1431082-Alexandrium_andersonii.AAC.1
MVMRDPRLEAGGRFLVDEVPPDLARSLGARRCLEVHTGDVHVTLEETGGRAEVGGCRAGSFEASASSPLAGSAAPPSSSPPPGWPAVRAGGPARQAPAGGGLSSASAGAGQASSLLALSPLACVSSREPAPAGAGAAGPPRTTAPGASDSHRPPVARGAAVAGGGAGLCGRLDQEARAGRGRRYELPRDLARGLTGHSAGARIAIRPAGAGRGESPARSDEAVYGGSEDEERDQA